jgi:hypothetical protein
MVGTRKLLTKRQRKTGREIMNYFEIMLAIAVAGGMVGGITVVIGLVSVQAAWDWWQARG